MNYSPNDLLMRLQQVWLAEAEIGRQIADVCHTSIDQWMADPAEREKRMVKLAKLKDSLSVVRNESESLSRLWKPTRESLTPALMQARENSRLALEDAAKAIRDAEGVAKSIKDQVLLQLVETNRSQEVLSAYGDQ